MFTCPAPVADLFSAAGGISGRHKAHSAVEMTGAARHAAGATIPEADQATE